MPHERQIHRVKVGTWNLAGRWSGRHAAALHAADADIWLLTEVPTRAALDGYMTHGSSDLMAPDRHWASILARASLQAHPWSEDPHPASTAADIDGHTFCSSILPWRSCGRGHPWSGRTCATKTEAVTKKLTTVLPKGASVWGGDWNHALSGPEQAGSLAGRQHIRDALDQLELQCPTAEVPHHISGLSTIDHVAVPSTATVHQTRRLSMATEGRRLSDHDAYIVDATLMAANGQWSVYVLDVEGLGPGHVYVGQTWHPVDVRRRQHIDGPRAARVFKRPGVAVGQPRPDLLPKFAPLRTRDEALAAEAAVATELRRRGLTVHGGH